MKKKYLFLILFSLIIGLTNAQTPEKKIGIGIIGGCNQYNGDLGNGIFDFGKAFYAFGGLSFNHYLNSSFDLGLQGTYGDYGFWKNSDENFLGKKYDFVLLLSYKFNNGYILKEKSKLAPFLVAGTGIAGYYGSNIYERGCDWVAPIGAGLKYQINNKFAVQYQFLHYYTGNDSRDNQTEMNIDDRYAQHSISLIYSFGGKKDSDGDGIVDRLDKCPNTPAGVTVDNNGCPVDADGDGVADYIDKCPLTPQGAKVDTQGCPLDTDADGVPDYLDKCPDTPKGATVDSDGCPIDTDGDGVLDYMDKCPNTPKGTAVDRNGCPLDADGDGVPDYLDKCPNTAKAAAVDRNGCPIDSDGDGVFDYLDNCPNTPIGVKVDINGCPEIKAETKKIFEQALTGIQFESGKDVIKKSSFSILNQVVNVMKENTDYKLQINGHTDNQGKPEMNLELSQKRAEAVKKYLADKGIDNNRMFAKGYGETIPIGDNNTADGRSKNRRVEFKVVF
jgi:OmpA-OmpF porin, OOP family